MFCICPSHLSGCFCNHTVFVLSLFFAADSEDSTVSIQIKLENEGSDEDIETDVLYSPQMALKLALTEWLQEFGVPHQYSSEFWPFFVRGLEHMGES